jgi:hypothetical protein
MATKKMDQFEETPVTDADKEVIEFVTMHCNEWRNNRDVNYLKTWEEYERMFRGIWDLADQSRESERSRLVTPALQQAIEAKQAEISEAVFGRGDFFDIADDMNDQNPADIELVRRQMHEDFQFSRTKKSIDDIILLAEMYGTGIGEIVIEEQTVMSPDTQPIEGTGMAAIGVTEKKQFMVALNAINPRNFLIDPNATTVETSLGVAIEEYMSYYTIIQGIEKGIYRKVNVVPGYGSTRLEETQEPVPSRADKIQVIRYYGLIPRDMLEGLEESESKILELFPEDTVADHYSDMVEAVVVIADNQYLLKAEPSPYMMKDRPVIAYQADSLPGRFWGRGTAEKGYNMQKAIDAQIRSHLDSLALTTAPMMAMDATRLPRGAKYEVKPGKNLLVNGNPNEIMMPFKFGTTDPANFQTAQNFQQMLLAATGTLDSSSMPGQVAGGEASGAGMSMALSGLMKKNKRALINFQEDFLIPFIRKAAWRFMQFDPERYPVKDFKFIPISTMGMVAREYEQQQMVGLMQTLGPTSPITPILLQGIIQASSLSNREDIIAQLQKMSQPDPQQAQMAQANMQLDMMGKQALVEKTKADAAKSAAEAEKAHVETQLAPQKAQAQIVGDLSKGNSTDQAQQDFDRRVKIAELMLKEADLKQNSKIVEMQMAEKNSRLQKTNAEFLKTLTSKL